MTEKNEILADALRHYGMQSQTLMLAEECAELIKACSKACRAVLDGQGASKLLSLIKDVTEEIADVEIMIMQMKLVYTIPDSDVDEIIEEKLKRLKERMNDGS